MSNSNQTMEEQSEPTCFVHNICFVHANMSCFIVIVVVVVQLYYHTTGITKAITNAINTPSRFGFST